MDSDETTPDARSCPVCHDDRTRGEHGHPWRLDAEGNSRDGRNSRCHDCSGLPPTHFCVLDPRGDFAFSCAQGHQWRRFSTQTTSRAQNLVHNYEHALESGRDSQLWRETVAELRTEIEVVRRFAGGLRTDSAEYKRFESALAAAAGGDNDDYA